MLVGVTRTDRLYGLVEELRAAAPRPRSARWLAERFEVSSRTVERDIAALQQSGVPIWAEVGRAGGYRLDPASTLPPINFTAEEATAVAVALAVSGPIPFRTAARAALRKLVSAMTVSGQEGARELIGRVRLVGDTAGDGRAAVARAIEQGVAQRRVLSLDYVDGEGRRTAGRLVEPHGLTGAGEHWYLLGWCRLRDGGRGFRLDRIEAAHVTAEPAPERALEDVAGGWAAITRTIPLDG